MCETHKLTPLAPQDAPKTASRLEDLARQARDAHAAAGQAVSDAVHHALTAGRALIAAKKLVPEGEWVRWVSRNCNFTVRHAQRYMKLVSAYEADATRVSHDVCGLSLRGALKRLTPPQPRAVAAPRARSAAQHTTGLTISADWDAAPFAERRRAVSNIGLWPLLEALPEEWFPALERWGML